MKYFTSTVLQLFLAVGSVTDLASAARIRGASSEHRYDRSRRSPGTTHPQTSEVGSSSSSIRSTTDNRKVIRRQLRQQKSSSPSPLPTKVPFSEEEEVAQKQERLDAVTNNAIEKEEKSSSPSPLPTKVAEMADVPPAATTTTTARSKTIGAKIADKKKAIRSSTVRLPITRRFGDRPFDGGDDEIGESDAPFKGVLGRAKPPRDGQHSGNGNGRNDSRNAGPTVVAVVPVSKYADGDRIAVLGSIGAANPKMAPRIPGVRDEKQKKLIVRPIGSSSSSLVRAPNVVGEEGSDADSDSDVVGETTIAAPTKNTRTAANPIPSDSGSSGDENENDATDETQGTPTAPTAKSGKKSPKSGKEDKKSKRSKTDHHKEDNKLTKKKRRR